MKFTVGDDATIETAQMKLRVKVEDASKGDIIMGKLESILSGNPPPGYEIGKVYEFKRSDIV
jgi:hypothetical protein